MKLYSDLTQPRWTKWHMPIFVFHLLSVTCNNHKLPTPQLQALLLSTNPMHTIFVSPLFHLILNLWPIVVVVIFFCSGSRDDLHMARVQFIKSENHLYYVFFLVFQL